MRSATFLIGEEARHYEQELLADCLPIIGHHVIGCCAAGQITTIPVVVIGAEGRPDVADLARVHELEGTGEVTAQWRFAVKPSAVLAIVDCQLTQPVRCCFRLAFRLPADRGVLADVARLGGFVLATRAPVLRPDGRLAAPGVFCEVPTHDLAAVLAGELRPIIPRGMRASR